MECHVDTSGAHGASIAARATQACSGSIEHHRAVGQLQGKLASRGGVRGLERGADGTSSGGRVGVQGGAGDGGRAAVQGEGASGPSSRVPLKEPSMH